MVIHHEQNSKGKYTINRMLDKLENDETLEAKKTVVYVPEYLPEEVQKRVDRVTCNLDLYVTTNVYRLMHHIEEGRTTVYFDNAGSQDMSTEELIKVIARSGAEVIYYVSRLSEELRNAKTLSRLREVSSQ